MSLQLKEIVFGCIFFVLVYSFFFQQNQHRIVDLDGAVHEILKFEPEIIRVSESWISKENREDNVDSLVVFHEWDSAAEDLAEPVGSFIIATAKATDRLYLMNANNGEIIRSVDEVLLKRPNGLTFFPTVKEGKENWEKVTPKLMAITERDAHRVTVVKIPSFETVLQFGTETLKRSYASAIRRISDNEYMIYVTDGYMDLEWSERHQKMRNSKIPPDHRLNERIQQFKLTEDENGSMSAELIRKFGDTQGSGRLFRVESIQIDEKRKHLIIADEHESNVKIYTLNGKFTGQTFGDGIFLTEPEGFVSYECPNDPERGYWLMTDQLKTKTRFHVFTMGTYQYIATFDGDVTRQTDGVGISQENFGPFSEGAFYALHADRSIAAFDLKKLREKLHLCS